VATGGGDANRGVVRTTEIRIAPEVGGQLAAIKVEPGARVRAGDVVAELSAVELTAAVRAITSMPVFAPSR
jgi:multidrug efflux pump subunit AcrA (membrane-fusion protein)